MASVFFDGMYYDYPANPYNNPLCLKEKSGIFINFNIYHKYYLDLRFPFIHRYAFFKNEINGKYWYIRNINGSILYSKNTPSYIRK